MKTRIQNIIGLIPVLLGISLFTNAQVITHSYRFNNTLAVSAPECGTDLTTAVALGACNPGPTAGSFISDTLPLCGLRRTVYHTNLHYGLRYPNTDAVVTNTYTIHLYVKTTNWGNRTWTRIIDFSNGLSDFGIYYKQNATAADRCLDFFPSGIVGTCPFFNDSTYYLLSFTRNGATGIIDVYVNSILFVSYNDAIGRYTGTTGTPIYIYRDDQGVSCESGEANFAYLSFSNQYSNQATVDSVYNHICAISNTVNSANFSFNPASSCDPTQNITVTYTGDIPSPGTGYTFNWNWDGASVISGSGMGPYVINWPATGTKNVSLTVTNTNCGNQNTKTQSFQLGQLSRTTINKTICEGQVYESYTTSGTYVDTFTVAGGCDSIRTLQLLVNPRSFTTITKTICEGQSFLGYTQDGVYVDTFTAMNGCDSIRTLTLNVTPRILTTVNQSICQGQSFLGYNRTGIYQDTFTAVNGCDSIRILNLTVNPLPRPDLGPDREICTDGDTVLLSPGNFSSYRWQDNSTASTYTVRQPGLYTVTVTNNCGTQSDDVIITEKICTEYFPTGFTPNGDGKNDLFKILNATGIQNYRLTVYDRWGQKVFETLNYLQGWNGKLNGIPQDNGVYIYYCTYSRSGVAKMARGSFVLVR